MYNLLEKRISNKDTNIFLLMILYKAIIDFAYAFFVSPIYNYAPGYNLDINNGKYILSWLYLFLIAFLIPKNNQKVSYMVLQLHTLIMIIPMLTVYSFTNQSSLFMLLIMGCFLFEIVAIKNVEFVFKLPTIKNGKFIIIVIIVLCTFANYIYIIRANGIHLEALNFSNVYEIRTGLIMSTGFLKYLISWQYRILTPYMIVSSYLRNNKLMFVIFSALQVLLYFVIPYKEIIFSVVLIIGMIIFLEKLSFLKSAITAIILTILGSTAIYSVGISTMPLSILPTRFMIEPAIIKFQHYAVFSQYLDKLYYSEGLIGRLLGIKYPYSQPSGIVVHSFFSTATSNSNTGYLAYAYDNMGVLGMIIMTLFFVFIMILIDSLADKLNKKYCFALIVYQMITLNDGDLLSCLLTGGLFITFIILSFDQESFRFKESPKKSIEKKI